MEDITLRRQQQKPGFMLSTSTPSTLAMHRDSQTISKVKPKIRIIHIFAPEIIKTDVANFRELVQRLTGKPPPDDGHHHHHLQKGVCKKMKKKPRHEHQQLSQEEARTCDKSMVMSKNKVELMRSAFVGGDHHQRVEVQEDQDGKMLMWNGGGGGFLGGFGDLDGFIQELGEFPLLTSHGNNPDATHNYGFDQEAQLIA